MMEEMELEIEKEPGAEKEAEEEAAEAEETIAAGGIELKVSLENPEIHIDKLIIKKKE